MVNADVDVVAVVRQRGPPTQTWIRVPQERENGESCRDYSGDKKKGFQSKLFSYSEDKKQPESPDLRKSQKSFSFSSEEEEERTITMNDKVYPDN